MKSRRKHEKERTEYSRGDTCYNDVTKTEAADSGGNLSTGGDDHRVELSRASELANKVFVGNISYRVGHKLLQ